MQRETIHDSSLEHPPRIRILGVELDLCSLNCLQAHVLHGVRAGRPYVIANHNLHSVYLYHRVPELRAFYRQADVIHADGMPLIWWARFLGYPARPEHRTTYADWVDPLMALASRFRLRVFHLGGRPGVGEQAARVLVRRYPGLVLETHHGYFDAHPESKENQDVLRHIHAFRPHVLMVGMGMPRQELWIWQNREQIPPAVILPSGACMDYVAGAVPTPPRWAGKWGLEWFFRLIAEPGRLWRRYLMEPFFLIPWVWRDLRGRCEAGGRNTSSSDAG